MGYANGWTSRSGWLNVTLTSEAGQRPLTGYSEEDGPALACASTEYDPDLWFAHPTELEALAEAKRLCGECPVREQCLERHLDEPDGVYGGYDAWERRIEREGPALCRRCRCLIPHSLSVCVACSKAEAKERARAKLRAAIKSTPRKRVRR